MIVLVVPIVCKGIEIMKKNNDQIKMLPSKGFPVPNLLLVRHVEKALLSHTKNQGKPKLRLVK